MYLASAWYARKHVAKAECWWLPGANTFRFVIRNIPRTGNLFSIRYRAWLRTDVPSAEDISVGTLLETELSEGERLLLPGGQDLPMICFRLQDLGSSLKLLVTDKMGNPLSTQPVDDATTVLMAEFSARARTLLLFKHDIHRLYAIRRFRKRGESQFDVFREYFLPVQASHERKAKWVSKFAEEVTVTI
jgi:hypothetical protein